MKCSLSFLLFLNNSNIHSEQFKTIQYNLNNHLNIFSIVANNILFKAEIFCTHYLNLENASSSLSRYVISQSS